MRIAFFGASGTGKTTLAKWLAEEYGLEFNPVGSRSVAKAMGFDSPYDVDKASRKIYEQSLKENPEDLESAVRLAVEGFDDSQESVRTLFQVGLQKAKIDWEIKRSSFVSDRTSVDDMAYAMLHCPTVVDSEFVARAAEHVGIYDLVIFCPMGSFINIDNDASRVSEMEYHRIFEGMVADSMDSLEQWYLVLGSPILEMRKAAIREAIDRLTT